jgi:hypothetical protein
MKPDPILEEIWRVKDELARRCGYDVDRVFDELQRLTAEEEKAGRKIIRSGEELRHHAAEEEQRRHELEVLAIKETPPEL